MKRRGIKLGIVVSSFCLLSNLVSPVYGDDCAKKRQRLESALITMNLVAGYSCQHASGDTPFIDVLTLIPAGKVRKLVKDYRMTCGEVDGFYNKSQKEFELKFSE